MTTAALVSAFFLLVPNSILTVENPPTAASWMQANPQDTLEPESADHPLSGLSACALTTSHLSVAGIPFERQATFRIPDFEVMQLPHDDHDASLINQCILSEIKLTSDSPAPQNAFAQIEADLIEDLGQPGPYANQHVIRGGSRLTARNDWSRQEAHWTLALDPDGHILIFAIAAPSQPAAGYPEALAAELRKAKNFAATTNLAASDIQRMQALLTHSELRAKSGRPNSWNESPEVIPFLIHWRNRSRQLPAAQQAAALYSADALLATLSFYAAQKTDLDQATQPQRTQLASAGAHFQYDELGSAYVYLHDWMKEALQAAPEAPAGQQAFLFFLQNGFTGNRCAQGEGFEEVIAKVTAYLQQHPDSPIRPDLLLDLGHAYRARVGTANGADGDPFQHAAKYKPDIQANTQAAIRCYRAAIAAAPGNSSIVKEATMSAWALIAGIAPLDAAFVAICD